jgi:hypothetical protein
MHDYAGAAPVANADDATYRSGRPNYGQRVHGTKDQGGAMIDAYLEQANATWPKFTGAMNFAAADVRVCRHGPRATTRL